jgi:hypothetical protein
VLESAARLWAGSGAPRDAACELITLVDRCPPAVRLAQKFLEGGPSASQAQLLRMAVDGTEEWTKDGPLGLFDQAELTPSTAPRHR